MTRRRASTELQRLIPDNVTLRLQIMNVMEAYAETAFKAGLDTSFSDYESFAMRKNKRKRA